MADDRDINSTSTYPENKKQYQPKTQQISLATEGHIFLSYSREDRDYVTKLANWLEGHGVVVWFDHDIDYGVKWEDEIINKLDSSAVVLVVMSDSSRKSDWVSKEIDHAKKQKLRIYPLLLKQMVWLISRSSTV